MRRSAIRIQCQSVSKNHITIQPTHKCTFQFTHTNEAHTSQSEGIWLADKLQVCMCVKQIDCKQQVRHGPFVLHKRRMRCLRRHIYWASDPDTNTVVCQVLLLRQLRVVFSHWCECQGKAYPFSHVQLKISSNSNKADVTYQLRMHTSCALEYSMDWRPLPWYNMQHIR